MHPEAQREAKGVAFCGGYEWGLRCPCVCIQGLLLCRMKSRGRKGGGRSQVENFHLYSCHNPTNIKGRPTTDIVYLTNDQTPNQVWLGRYLMLSPGGVEFWTKVWFFFCSVSGRRNFSLQRIFRILHTERIKGSREQVSLQRESRHRAVSIYREVLTGATDITPT